MIDPDFSDLTSINDYTTARTWIERNKQYLSSQRHVFHQIASEISRILRAAALDGQVTTVEILRYYG